MNIRKAELKDANLIADLEAKCLKNPWPLSQIEYEISSNPCAITIIAENDGELLGYLDYLITFDSSSICRIAVYHEHRNKGIASSLLEEMDKNLKENSVSWSTLEVRISNENAINLYKKRGYELITTKKAYYDDGEDALYMVRCY